MTLLASLTNRIFLATALLSMGTIGLAIYLVSARVTRQVEGELERGLAESASLLDRQRADLANHYLTLARLVADLPKLKAAVNEQDAPTVAPLGREYQRQLDADVLLVTGHTGLVLFASPDAPPAAQLASVAAALEGRESAAFWPHPHGVLQLVTVPISVGLASPDVLGTLTAGFLIDDRRAEVFKSTTASDVAFAIDGRVVSATLPEAVRPALTSLASRRGVAHVTLGGEDFAAVARLLRLPLPEASTRTPEAVAFVLRSRTSQLRGLQTVRAALLTTALLSIVLATVLSYVVARSVTRPLGAITASMREIAATGDLARKVRLPGPAWYQDEDARLLATTFNTLTDSVACFQREAAQRERLLSLGRLSTVIAHEVRNPLMIIKAALRSLRPGTAPAEQQDAVSDIDEQVNRLNRIVNDVLDFSRPVRIELSQADLGRLCHEAADAVRHADPQGPRIAVEAPAIAVTTDPERLRAALVNLVSNARNAVAEQRVAVTSPTPRGDGVDDDVRVTAERAGPGRVRITVRDRGPGIPPGQLAQVFEPYFTTRRAGTGLGLPITRNIIESLGGMITVGAARPGTVVTVDLPEVAPDPQAASTRTPA
jgi:signal transduction histidine kinase